MDNNSSRKLMINILDYSDLEIQRNQTTELYLIF